MNLTNLRIFVTTSHISTVYMTLLAESTKNENNIDILLVDTGTRRAEKIEHMRLTAALYSWRIFHNFSQVAPEIHDLNPNWRKRMTRRLKTLAVFKPVYKLLLDRFMNKMDAKYRGELTTLLSPYLSDAGNVELFLMTGTYLNSPLKQLFPDAKLNYMEHGVGDYHQILKEGKPIGEMYAVFAAPFRDFLAKQGMTTSWVHDLSGLDRFSTVAKQLLEAPVLKMNDAGTNGKKIIFILMEAVDMYEVPASFWSAYLDKIFAQLKNPADYHFLLKPHHLQSAVSIRLTREHLDKLGYAYTLLDDERIKSSALEVLFVHWAEKVEQVFFLFSSAGFYLSALYPGYGIRFRYSVDFLTPYVKNAPLQYQEFYRDIIPIIENVLNKNCEKY
ncbi:MAG: polysialyltransferase family glycosyltransferase [Bacteroidia bacterium]